MEIINYFFMIFNKFMNGIGIHIYELLSNLITHMSHYSIQIIQ